MTRLKPNMVVEKLLGAEAERSTDERGSLENVVLLSSLFFLSCVQVENGVLEASR